MIYPQYGYPSPTYYPQQMQNMYNAQQQQPVQQQQIRSGGIVSVPSEEEARRYPVAPGFTVTMRDETGPYLYEKTMGYSQLDQPIFRKAKMENMMGDVSPEAQNAIRKALNALGNE